jgi:threonine aldolase
MRYMAVSGWLPLKLRRSALDIPYGSTPPQFGFASDNAAGASPEVIAAIAACNLGQAQPYGADEYSRRIEQRLNVIFERDVIVFLVATGSAANALCLSVLTPPWGSVLCHSESHINNDECGAPEFYTGGAKLVMVGGASAKINAAELRQQLRRKVGNVHSAQPACVSITQATEVGSVYTLDEIREIGEICRDAGVRMHMDGARFANALISLNCSPAEMTWTAGVDALSFGATKNGVMAAEAIVLFDHKLATELGYRRKRGGLLSSKMRFMSAQFDAYLQDDLWLANAHRANAMALQLETSLRSTGVELLAPAEANILFCRFPQAVIKDLLSQGFRFYHDRWGPGVVRLVTSFATTIDDIDHFVAAIRGSLA